MNRGEVQCYGCGSTIQYVDAYVLADEYYCEVCIDEVVKEGNEWLYMS